MNNLERSQLREALAKTGEVDYERELDEYRMSRFVGRYGTRDVYIEVREYDTLSRSHRWLVTVVDPYSGERTQSGFAPDIETAVSRLKWAELG